MQKFQSLSAKTKVAIATVALAGVIGAGVVAAPKITQKTHIDPTVVPTPTPCLVYDVPHGGYKGGSICADSRFIIPYPSASPDIPDTTPHP